MSTELFTETGAAAVRRVRVPAVQLNERIRQSPFSKSSVCRQIQEQALKQREARHLRGWAVDSLAASAAFELQGGHGTIRLSQNSGQQFKVWDCAVVLARYLESRPDLVRGRGVVELGCGASDHRRLLLCRRAVQVHSLGAAVAA